METKQLGYTVIFQKDNQKGGFIATVLSLPGCVSYGKDLDEATAMIKDAIVGYLHSLKKHGEKIPTEEKTYYSQVYIHPQNYPLAYA